MKSEKEIVDALKEVKKASREASDALLELVALVIIDIHRIADALETRNKNS